MSLLDIHWRIESLPPHHSRPLSHVSFPYQCVYIRIVTIYARCVPSPSTEWFSLPRHVPSNSKRPKVTVEVEEAWRVRKKEEVCTLCGSLELLGWPRTSKLCCPTRITRTIVTYNRRERVDWAPPQVYANRGGRDIICFVP